MTIRKGNTEYMFNQRFKSRDRELAGIKIDIWDVETAGVCRGGTHAILGHLCKHITYLTAKFLDLNKMAHDKICESCIKDKQRPKNVAKKVEFKAKKPGNQVYFDISSIQYKSLGGSKFWLLFVDERTRYKKSYFLSLKSQMAKKGMEYIHFMETNTIKITTFRCDNEGEHIKFKEKLV